MEKPARAQLSITLTHDGQLVVTGPINDLMLCYGLLEGAKDQIRNHVAAKARESSIQIAQGWPPAGLMNRQ